MVEPAALLHQGLGAIALALEVATAIVILVAAARAFAYFLAHLTHPDERGGAKHRRRFGRSLLLALDFAVGADVIRLAIEPDLRGVMTAGLVAIVRVILTFALEYELKQEQRDEDRENTT